MKTIDLNSDLGESYGAWSMGDDAAMIDIVSSANVACGFHAGDPAGILRTLKVAAQRGVAIGAHVSYPDRVGFGRRDMDIAPADLIADVVYQVGALQGLATTVGATIRYVKPHGALYNRMAVDPVQGAAVIEAIRSIDASLALVCLANAPIITQARAAGLHAVAEAYADRAYTKEGRLVSRREPGAVLHEPARIAERMVQLALNGTLEAIDGSVIHVEAQSICVHGDSPGAVAIAREVRRRLEAEGISVSPLIRPCGVSRSAG